ncbi:MAG TPA: CRISPR-associated endonuclease Cas3'' [Euryarchaeota archaeon]|nr:CRISPR-associated endonuclease Cas3'' [Euryarchaeota archaeon]
MKPCAFKAQSLSDHISGCLGLLRKYLDRNREYPLIVSRRIEVASGGDVEISSEEVKELLKLCVVFHDLGKGYEYYQRRFDRNCLTRNGASFEYHEIISAISSYKYSLNKWGEADPRTNLLTMSVANHHHAFREMSNMTHNRVSRKISEILKQGVCEEIGNIYYVLEGIDPEIPEHISLEQRDLVNFLNWIRSQYRMKQKGTLRWIKLYTLILKPLIIVDNIDAYRARKDSRERFSSFLRELNTLLGGD